MAHGSDAANAGMDTLNGTEDRRDGYDEINKTRDYIAQRTSTITPISKGGTGGVDAASARVNLDVVGNDQVIISTAGGTIANKIPRYDGIGRLAVASPAAPNQAASKAYVDAATANKLSTAGGTVTGDLLLPNANPATDGYTVAYINSNGRVSRGASSERYKKYITAIDTDELGDVWPELVRYQMRGGDGTWKYGYIAERLAESEDLKTFVVYDTEGRPDSIDFIALLMAQNAQLHARLVALEADRA